jgi:hypothetical protein
LEQHNPYEGVSRRIIKTQSLQRLLKEVRVLIGDEEEDQQQDVILLVLQLLKTYPHFTEEEIKEERFVALLRRAYERDLIDRLRRKCMSCVWVGIGKKRNKKIQKLSVEVFDLEEKYEDVNETDGRVTLPRVEDPESEYMMNHILGRMREVFFDRWAIVGDLLANEDLGDYGSGVTPPYAADYANFDRIPAKVVCDAHGLTERRRKTLLGKLREFLVVEGVRQRSGHRSGSATPVASAPSMPSSGYRIASGACPSSGIYAPWDRAHRVAAGLSVACTSAPALASLISPRPDTGGLDSAERILVK